jgi:hypothetical protein
LRKQDSAWFGALAAAAAAGVALLRRRVMLALVFGLAAAGCGVASRRWSRTERGPFPYSLRWILAFPHPISPALVQRGVEAVPGDHVLEIGPGTGRHAAEVARSIEPAGTLDVFDVQQSMLDAVMRRAREEGIANITPTHGQAGEVLLDPDYTSLRELRSLAEPCGFRFVRREGSPFAYVARFEAT